MADGFEIDGADREGHIYIDRRGREEGVLGWVGLFCEVVICRLSHVLIPSSSSRCIHRNEKKKGSEYIYIRNIVPFRDVEGKEKKSLSFTDSPKSHLGPLYVKVISSSYHPAQTMHTEPLKRCR